MTASSCGTSLTQQLAHVEPRNMFASAEWIPSSSRSSCFRPKFAPTNQMGSGTVNFFSDFSHLPSLPDPKRKTDISQETLAVFACGSRLREHSSFFVAAALPRCRLPVQRSFFRQMGVSGRTPYGHLHARYSVCRSGGASVSF